MLCRPFSDYRIFTYRIRSQLGTVRKKGPQPSLEERRSGFRQLRIALQVRHHFASTLALQDNQRSLSALLGKLLELLAIQAGYKAANFAAALMCITRRRPVIC